MIIKVRYAQNSATHQWVDLCHAGNVIDLGVLNEPERKALALQLLKAAEQLLDGLEDKPSC